MPGLGDSIPNKPAQGNGDCKEYKADSLVAPNCPACTYAKACVPHHYLIAARQHQQGHTVTVSILFIK